MIDNTYTYEKARSDVEAFLNPTDREIPDYVKKTALEEFELRIAKGEIPEEAMAAAVNFAYEGTQTDEDSRLKLRGFLTEEEYPMTWKAVWDTYLKYRDLFCPFVSFQMLLGSMDTQQEELATWMAREDTIKRMVADGLPEEFAVLFASGLG